MLKPVGFFDGNPALDMPRSPAACHTGDGHVTAMRTTGPCRSRNGRAPGSVAAQAAH